MNAITLIASFADYRVEGYVMLYPNATNFLWMFFCWLLLIVLLFFGGGGGEGIFFLIKFFFASEYLGFQCCTWAGRFVCELWHGISSLVFAALLTALMSDTCSYLCANKERFYTNYPIQTAMRKPWGDAGGITFAEPGLTGAVLIKD